MLLLLHFTLLIVLLNIYLLIMAIQLTFILSALREIGIDESKIIKKTTILISFSGEQKNTLGEIELPVYAK